MSAMESLFTEGYSSSLCVATIFDGRQDDIACTQTARPLADYIKY